MDKACATLITKPGAAKTTKRHLPLQLLPTLSEVPFLLFHFSLTLNTIYNIQHKISPRVIVLLITTASYQS
jgi:hypothetical protein